MGADIHAYIEYEPKYPDPRRKRSFGGKLYLERDYIMFGVLAGVRTHPEYRERIRGIPDDLGWDSGDDYWLRVVDDGSEYANQSGYASRSSALRYIERSGSRWHPEDGPDSRWPKVSNPDAHSCSWVTTAEYAARLAEAQHERANLPEQPYKVDREVSPDYVAVLAAMFALPNARLVFWFDN